MKSMLHQWGGVGVSRPSHPQMLLATCYFCPTACIYQARRTRHRPTQSFALLSARKKFFLVSDFGISV